MTEERVPALLEKFMEDIQGRKKQADDEPEGGHAWIDELTEEALRAVVNGEPDAMEKATAAVMLLDTEDHEGWTRWYA